MKIIIQCAGSKNTNAGYFKTKEGKPIKFVAAPNQCNHEEGFIYQHPDDFSERGISWKEELLEYNIKNENNYNLLPAYKLYKNNIYRALVEKFGVENIFILSAGWGLIRSDFLMPVYNITFSSSRKCIKRYIKDSWHDLNMLPNSSDNVIFLGGKNYLQMFNDITKNYKGKRIVFYNSDIKPHLNNNCEIIRFNTMRKTNWHYECAEKLITGELL